jgi:hypothetical protein
MRSHMHSDLPSLDQHCGYAREIFSVEEERVILDAQQGWGCSCATYAEHGQCLHVEKAQSFRHMRRVRREDDTIEFQLNAAQLQELSQAEEAEVLPAKAAASPAPPRLRRHSPWTTVAVATAMSAVSSGITYLATARAPAGATAEPPGVSATLAVFPAPQAHVASEVQVTFANPFDATEVFTFPAGTTEADARDAVATLLLNRARERDASERARLERSMSLADAG